MPIDVSYLLGGGIIGLIGLIIGSIKYTHSVKDVILHRMDSKFEDVVSKEACESEKHHIFRQLEDLNSKTHHIEKNVESLIKATAGSEKLDTQTRQIICKTEKKVDNLFIELQRIKSSKS